MPSPVTAAIASARPAAISFRTGSTGSFTGWPLIRMVPPPMSPSRAGFSARNAPYRTRKVAIANALKMTRLHVERRPENGRVAQRVEPQRVDVVGQRRSAAQDHRGHGGEKNQAAPAPARPPWRRPVDDGAWTGVRMTVHVGVADVFTRSPMGSPDHYIRPLNPRSWLDQLDLGTEWSTRALSGPPAARASL